MSKTFTTFLILLVVLVPVSYAVNFNYEYDGRGNLIKDENLNYEYDAFGNLAKIIDSNGNLLEEYYYDEDGTRIKKNSYTTGQKIGTYYPPPDFIQEFQPNEKIEDIPYYNDGFDIVAKKNSGGIFYFHNNHLGSTNLITDENKKIVEQTDYQPFGLPLNDLNERYTFTGKEQDETELYYFESRYYNPKTMHFTQPDTIIPDVYDPLSLNRYSYVRNNPIKYTDPNGHTFWSVNPFGLLFRQNNLGFDTTYIPFEGIIKNIFRNPFIKQNSVKFGRNDILFPFNTNNNFEVYNIKNDRGLIKHNTESDINNLKKDLKEEFNKMKSKEISKGEFYDKRLPRKGDKPFKEPKDYKHHGIRFDKQGRAISKDGSRWEFVEKEGRFHRYESENAKFGEYDNIDPDGLIRHLGRSKNKRINLLNNLRYFFDIQDDYS